MLRLSRALCWHSFLKKGILTNSIKKEGDRMAKEKTNKTKNILLGVLIIQLILLPLATAQNIESSVSSIKIAEGESITGEFSKITPIDNNNLKTSSEKVELLVATNVNIPIQGRVTYQNSSYTGAVQVCVENKCNLNVSVNNGIFYANILDVPIEDPHSAHTLRITVNGTQVVNETFYPAGAPQGNHSVNGVLTVTGPSSFNESISVNGSISVIGAISQNGNIVCDNSNNCNFVLNETDPKIGNLQNESWCTSDGIQVNCQQTAPILIENDTLQSVSARGASTNDSVTLDGDGDGITTIGGTLYIGGGYPNGLSLYSNGDLYIGRDLYQTSGKVYYSGATRYNGSFEIADALKVGVSADGTDPNYLLINSEGYLTVNGITPVVIYDNLRVTALPNCNTIDTDVNGDLVCGTDEINDADANATNEIQNLWETIQADTGSATPISPNDNLTIIGSGITTTSIIGNTLTINSTETDSIALPIIDSVNASLQSHITNDNDLSPVNELQNIIPNAGLKIESNNFGIIDCPAGQIVKSDGINNWTCADDDIGAGVSDIWVNTAGDNMTGNLNINNANLTVNGNVGIGTINPQYKLEVNGSASTGSLMVWSSGLYLSQFGNNNQYGTAHYGIGNGNLDLSPFDPTNTSVIVSGYYGVGLITSNGVGNLILTREGNVGIGTTTPSALLELNSSGTTTAKIRSTGADSNPAFQIINDAQTWELFVWGTSADQLAVVDRTNSNIIPFVIETNATTNLLVLDTNDMVGIGTAAPNAKLDVNGTVNAANNITTQTGFCIGANCISSWGSGGGGNITEVVAGTGLTGGGTTGIVTLNVGAGTGITINPDNITADCNAILGHACGTDNVNDADANPTNEIQNLTTGATTISITSGNTITVPFATNSSYATSAGTANTATALASDGSDCAANNYPRGVGVNGNAQFCTPDDDAPDNDAEVPDIITINNGLLYAPLSGSVGIGTATPTHALNVVGTTNFTGNSIFGGSTITLDNTASTTINQTGTQLSISQTNAAGNSLVDIAPISSDRSSQGLIRFFRLLNTSSASSAFQILPGDNTGNVVHDFRIKTGTTTVFNEQGYDMDFRFEGDNNANLLFLDAGNDRVGIGTATPSAKLDAVAGSGNAIQGVTYSTVSGEGGVVGISFGDGNAAGVVGISNGTGYAGVYGIGSGDDFGVVGVSNTGTAGYFSSPTNGLIVASGDVGIGNTVPQAQLHLGPAATGLIPGQVPKMIIKGEDTPALYDQGLYIEHPGEGWSLMANGTDYGIMTKGSNQSLTANGPVSLKSAAGTTTYLRVDASGNVGIGTANPNAKLDVEVTSGGAASIGSSLNNASGPYSIAMGYNTSASGLYSTAMGIATTASGFASTAMGYTTASGNSSTAMGYNTNASGPFSTAMGEGTTASGGFATTAGFQTIASGTAATAMGIATTASGFVSTAMGFITTASGNYSTAMGYFTTASGNASTAMGQAITANATNSFGIGLSNTNYTINQPNTMAIMGGNVGIGTVTPNSKLHVNGSTATAISTKIANYTLTSSDSVILCDTGNGATTITLPSTSGIAGRMYTIKKKTNDGNSCTIVPTGALIDGSGGVTLGTFNQYVTVITDGTNWYKIANN